MKAKFLLALAALSMVIFLAALVRADDGTFTGARGFVISQDFIRNEDLSKLCFVSKGGANVRAYDSPCPIEKVYNAEEQGLLKRLGARKKLLRGWDVIFTRHMIFVFDPRTGQFVLVNGVTHHGELADEAKTQVRLVMVSNRDDAACQPRITLRHELAHAIFLVAGMDSSFLDHAPDATPCDFSDNTVLEQIVYNQGAVRELPPGPLRDRLKAAKP